MHTFIELPTFTRYSADYFGDGELAELQKSISSRPTQGDVVPGTHGVRKLRWSRAGMGKRGGACAVFRTGLSRAYLVADGVCQKCA